jgi:hypothetical protein
MFGLILSMLFNVLKFEVGTLEGIFIADTVKQVLLDQVDVEGDENDLLEEMFDFVEFDIFK